MGKHRIESLFPHIADSGYSIASPATTDYNCVAWAAGDPTSWWWPDPQNIGYWPSTVPREETVEAFVKAFEILGYSRCQETAYESQCEKVAIYADLAQRPTHVVRQLASGRWTSKLGKLEDIEHEWNALRGSQYGDIAAIMKRRHK